MLQKVLIRFYLNSIGLADLYSSYMKFLHYKILFYFCDNIKKVIHVKNTT